MATKQEMLNYWSTGPIWTPDICCHLSQWKSICDRYTRGFLFPIICILRLTAVSAPLLLIRNPWIGGCHGFLGHMRGFPVARSSRRCLDQKPRAIFIQEKESIGCRWLPDYTHLLNWGFLFQPCAFWLFQIRSKPVSSTSIDWKQEWV